MRRVLGIDPGTKKHGWCLVDFTVRSAPIWVQGGHTEEPFMLLDSYAPDPTMLVVVEQPRALHNPMANVAVMGTAWEGGAVYGYAGAKQFQRLKVGPQEWRIALVGNSRRGENVDHKVEAELRRILRQMPPRSSAHARDAAGVAVVGARMWLAGPYSTDRARLLSSRIERAPCQPTSHPPTRGTP
jgi:Holliday junction resolvasome RuvABC endonuclease subunit